MRRNLRDAFKASIYEADITPDILCGSIEVVQAYWEGFGLSSKKFYFKKMAAGFCLLALCMGVAYHLVPYDETSDLVSLEMSPSSNGIAIDYIGVLPSKYDDYVYDLETKSHHFGVMPGNLDVHKFICIFYKT
eukprot:evm.model.NODE_28510_length_9357_cov_25.002138.2